MATDDAAARKARAEALRQRIEKLTESRPAAGQPETPAGRPQAAAPESPAEFVHRRMHELGSAGPSPAGRSGLPTKKKPKPR